MKMYNRRIVKHGFTACEYQMNKEIGMKQLYEAPNVVLVVVNQSDIVTASPGDNYEGDDFPAFGG